MAKTKNEKYTLIIAVDGTETRLPYKPKYPELQSLVSGGRAGQLIERCKVRLGNRRCDCIVNEEGAINGMPQNPKATELYRADWAKEYPFADNTNVALYGVAVVFIGWRL